MCLDNTLKVFPIPRVIFFIAFYCIFQSPSLFAQQTAASAMSKRQRSSDNDHPPQSSAEYKVQGSRMQIDNEFESAILAYNQEAFHRAFELFKKLAEKGHLDALNNLGTLYQTGQGTPKSYIKATASYQIAASEGHIDAAINLSTLYRLGIGLSKNLAESYAWAIVAARHGDSEASALRDMIKKGLTKTDLLASETAAKKYLTHLSKTEIELTWFIPAHLKTQNVPEAYKQDIKPQVILLPKQYSHPAKPMIIFSPLSSDVFPKEFSIMPQEFENNPKNIQPFHIPKGFSAITPKTETNQQSEAHFKPLTQQITNFQITNFQINSPTEKTQMNSPF